MAPPVVPYDPPPRPRPRSRSRSRTRLSSGFEAIEHLANDTQQVAAEVERAARFGETLADDYREACPGAWLNQPSPARGEAPRRRERQEEQTTTDDEVEEWEDPPSPKERSRSRTDVRRTMVSEGSQTSKRNLKGRSPPWIQSDDGYESLDTFKAALADARSFVDTLHSTTRSITTLRSRLTGSNYSKKPLRRRRQSTEPLTPTDEAELASLTTSARKEILLTYHTIQALKSEYPLFTKPFSSSPQLLRSSSSYKTLTKSLSKLYGSFADLLNFVEDRAGEEKKDMERGVADQRLMAWMRECEPGLQEEEVLSELKAAKREAGKKGVEELRPESFARRWALENPSTEIDHSLQAIDLLEHGFMKTEDLKKGTSGMWDKIGGLLHPSTKSRPSKPRNKDTKKPKKRQQRYFDLGKDKGAESSSDDSDADLLGPDGQLPYSIPTDDPNAVETVENQIDDLKRKKRMERTAFPFLVLEWICILALYLYWFISRQLGNPNPLGNVDLGSHLGDDAWGDTTDGVIQTTFSASASGAGSGNGTAMVEATTTEEAMSTSGSASATITAEKGAAVTAMPVSTSISTSEAQSTSMGSATDP
ncbi:hypothetical protein BCR35DRAFT_333911 [Leucosporidium creatinivorum]|uniref:Uncharacterized protein n=1 Tax=Leucosporidium creatinivorum TaxID=106004 RepID=A0A1Y2EN44_9BASI|nr:hypothetical protein BCR35DRAFT_333911 [Leucosporidium creatinivorum]